MIESISYKLSVIIPVFNGEKYIRKCVESVLMQAVSDMEIIIINDGSTDNTLNILSYYGMRYTNIKIITITSNRGVSYARNIGLHIAKGTYITFVDADDYIELNMYKTMIATLEQYNADIVECSCRKVKPNGSIVNETHLKRSVLKGSECLKHYMKQQGVQNYMVNKIYKRKLFQGKSFPAFKYSEDYYMNVLLHKQARKKVIIPYVFYNYVMHTQSATGKKISLDIIDGVKSGGKVLNILENTDYVYDAAAYVYKYIFNTVESMDRKMAVSFIWAVRRELVKAMFYRIVKVIHV